MFNWAKNTPHLFGKMVVIWCVLWGTAFCLCVMRIVSRIGHDATGLLGVILAFLGGELLFMCMRAILSEKARKVRKENPDE